MGIVTLTRVPDPWIETYENRLIGLDGYVNTTYRDLVRAFGVPHRFEEPGEKVDVQWTLADEGGNVVTVYNYKDGPNYMGSHGMAVEEITDWHIAGSGSDSVSAVINALEGRGKAETPSERVRRWVGPCSCECNSGGFCGGCGHAGCGRR